MLHRGEEPALYFWRTATGVEVDLVVEAQTKIIPVEIKGTATPRPDMVRGIAAFKRDFGERAAAGYVVYAGSMMLPLGAGVTALPIAAL
jgi:predicted AAA+ superfamily ATPase